MNGKVICILTVCLLIMATIMSFGKDAPPKVASALVIKLGAFEKGIGASSEVTIHVIGSNELAAELKKVIGSKIGAAVLKDVTSGNALPSSKPSIICLSDASKVSEVTAYSRANKVLTITNVPSLVAQGITLGLGLNDAGKPEILLNMTSSKEEGLGWNQAILKVAKTVK